VLLEPWWLEIRVQSNRDTGRDKLFHRENRGEIKAGENPGARIGTTKPPRSPRQAESVGLHVPLGALGALVVRDPDSVQSGHGTGLVGAGVCGAKGVERRGERATRRAPSVSWGVLQFAFDFRLRSHVAQQTKHHRADARRSPGVFARRERPPNPERMLPVSQVFCVVDSRSPSGGACRVARIKK
jgi:hypothetical protein